MGFESTIPVLERANAFHALDRAANVIGLKQKLWDIFHSCADLDIAAIPRLKINRKLPIEIQLTLHLCGSEIRPFTTSSQIKHLPFESVPTSTVGLFISDHGKDEERLNGQSPSEQL
jgi:hypothetical protein